MNDFITKIAAFRTSAEIDSIEDDDIRQEVIWDDIAHVRDTLDRIIEQARQMVHSSITLEKEETTMDHFIVVGVYTDNNNSFAERVTAETPEQAVAIVAENMRMEPAAECLLLIGAVPGQTYLAPASEDGLATYVLDLATS